jgi:hypothetical protein
VSEQEEGWGWSHVWFGRRWPRESTRTVLTVCSIPWWLLGHMDQSEKSGTQQVTSKSRHNEGHLRQDEDVILSRA